MPTEAATSPRPTDRPDPSRAGAVWVAGTGAFLLVAAAAVFVAVHWARIPEVAKLAAVVALTGAFLGAGRRLRPALPATAGVVFHLGAFLVPVDVAAVALRAEVGLGGLLLAEGMVGAATFAFLARWERSSVLRWATIGAVVVAAVGLGAVTPVPAAAALVGIATLAAARRWTREALVWAATAGLAPMLALALPPILVDRLDLASSGWVAILVAVVAAGLFGREAQRSHDVALAALAATSALVGALSLWADLDPVLGADRAAVAAAFVVVEGLALLTRRDRFWGPLAATVASAAEVLATLPTVVLALVVAGVPLAAMTGFDELVAGADGFLLATAASIALAWAVADLRRGPTTAPLLPALATGGRWAPATPALAASGLAALVFAGTSPLVTAAAMTGAGAVGVAARRPLAGPVAAALALAAPLTAEANTPLVITLGLVGSLTVVVAAARTRSRWLSGASLVPIATVAALVEPEAGPAATLAGTAAALWVIAAVADHIADRHHASEGGATKGRGSVAAVPRVALFAVLAAAVDLEPTARAGVAALVTALAVLDAERRHRPRIGLLAAASSPLVLSGLAAALGVSGPAVGVVLAAGAVALALSPMVAPARWAESLLAAAALLAAGGLVVAAPEAVAFGWSSLVVGVLLVAAGILGDHRPSLASGAGLATIGTWCLLAAAGVAVSEPYLAPVALLLAVVGHRARLADRTTSSWLAYGPAVALLGGAGLVERIAGGPGGHALVAGAVGAVAVVAGGRLRLAGPLVLGTGLLVALTGYESLAVTAAVPTWAWLALAGAALLGAGVAMERSHAGPRESGRRLVDAVATRFE